jgi:hypothetical protein
MINAFQLIAYMPLLNISMPDFLFIFFMVINSFSLGLDFIDFGYVFEKWFGLKADSNNLGGNLQKMGIASENNFSNLSTVIFAGLLMSILFGLTFLVYKLSVKF